MKYSFEKLYNQIMIDHSNSEEPLVSYCFQKLSNEAIQPKKRKMGTPWWRDTHLFKNIFY